MPTYDYRCEKCGYEFERFQSMTEKPVKKCPECAGTVRRLIGGGAGLIFKGKGFYQTDYKKSSASTSSAPKEKNGGGDAPCGKAESCPNCK
jgi:putative FmdB family regulatory protein